MSPALGVDFGTSTTVGMLRWPDGRIRPLLFDGTPLLPSAVFAPPDGSLSVGGDALHHGRHRPDSLEPNPKRCIDDGAVLLGGRELPVVELVAAVLGRVGQEATRVAGPPEALILSHPAGWGPVRRLTLSDAAATAGLPAPEFVPEPVAAARYFGSVLGGAVAPGQALVVYDLGAGTFDVSVIRSGEVLASDGVDDVGGLDFDAAIVGWLRQHYDPASWERLTTATTVEDRQLRRELWAEARIAKEMLSRGASVLLRPPLLTDEVPFTLAEFERLARPLVERTIRTTAGLIRYCGVTAGQVLLVGGSSRIPLVATELHRAIGVAPTITEQPETVVAEGCLAAAEAPVTTTESVTLAAPVSAAPAAMPASPMSPVSPAAVSASMFLPAMSTAVTSGVPAQRSPTADDTAHMPAVAPPHPPQQPLPPRPAQPVGPPLDRPPAQDPPHRRRTGRRLAVTLVGVLALVAALAAIVAAPNVFDSKASDRPSAGPSSRTSTVAVPSPTFPDWPVRYADALDKQSGWSAAGIPSENAECFFGNSRLEIEMGKSGIVRCPGRRDEMTDFALTIGVYLLDGLPCAGIWFRRGTHESGKDASYVLRVCQLEMALGHHHSTGNITDFARFPIEEIRQEGKINIGLVVRGSEISLYRGGRFVGRASDPAYPRGRISLGIAVNREIGSGRVGFGNVEVRWP